MLLHQSDCSGKYMYTYSSSQIHVTSLQIFSYQGLWWLWSEFAYYYWQLLDVKSTGPSFPHTSGHILHIILSTGPQSTHVGLVMRLLYQWSCLVYSTTHTHLSLLYRNVAANYLLVGQLDNTLPCPSYKITWLLRPGVRWHHMILEPSNRARGPEFWEVQVCLCNWCLSSY